MKKYHIGIFGLGVMGSNFAKNFLSKGFLVGVYNKEKEFVEKFLVENEGNQNLAGFFDIEEFVNSLEKPRKIILMITAGQAVDDVINILVKYLEPGDIIVDGGNSYFKDTERRYDYLKSIGIHLIGMGISGGAEGALNGPALMPGGDLEAYKLIEPFLTNVAAESKYGPCVAFVGKRSAGHFVKMIHNGIEYVMLQSIAEIYDIMRNLLKLSPNEISNVFSTWNNELFGGFLLGKASEVLKIKDEKTGLPLIDLILDVTGQKGTGLWTSQTALEIQIPVPTIISSVLVRFISIFRDLRCQIAKKEKEISKLSYDDNLIVKLKNVMEFNYLTAFVEGLWMIDIASKTFSYETKIEDILKIWRSGSIVASNIIDFLLSMEISNVDCLLKNDSIAAIFKENYSECVEVSTICKKHGIPLLTTDSALNFYLSMTRGELPTNIIQAIRDAFGYHGFYRKDDPNNLFHIN